MAFTGVLAVATISLGVYAAKQARDIKQYVAATRSIADAAKKSADVGEAALVTTQRAFAFNSFVVNVVGSEIWLMIRWENSGATPTKEIRNWVSWKTFPHGPPKDYQWPNLDESGNPTADTSTAIKFIIGPKTSQGSQMLKIPISTFEKVRGGDLRLFIWGWAEYHDVYEGTPTHRTEFCNEVVVTNLTKEGDRVTVALHFPMYGQHNSAN